jgi:hypothetical protein
MTDFRLRFSAQRTTFSVLSTPYSADGTGIVSGGCAQFAGLVAGAALYAHHAIASVT